VLAAHIVLGDVGGEGNSIWCVVFRVREGEMQL
jgi:hypothetical protein